MLCKRYRYLEERLGGAGGVQCPSMSKPSPRLDLVCAKFVRLFGKYCRPHSDTHVTRGNGYTTGQDREPVSPGYPVFYTVVYESPSYCRHTLVNSPYLYIPKGTTNDVRATE